MPQLLQGEELPNYIGATKHARSCHAHFACGCECVKAGISLAAVGILRLCAGC